MTTRQCILLSLILLTMVSCSHNQYPGSCRMESSSGSGTCVGHIRCKSGLENFYSVMSNWDCINRNRYYNNYNMHSYGQNYILYVHLENIDDDASWNSLQSYAQRIHYLYVTTGTITSLPIVIRSMENIEEFEIINNKMEVLEITDYLNKQGLKKMDLSHNAITTVSEVNVGLQEQNALLTLDISNNLIELLPSKIFSAFVNLKTLDLSNNNINMIDMSTFEGLTHLTKLDLSYNKLTAIGHAFIRFINLQHLFLQHNKIKKILETNLISTVKLEDLNLSYNDIEDIEIESFTSLSGLLALDISHNRIKIIKKSLFKNATNLESLFLADNDIEIIENGAFECNKINNFSIENNHISGSIVKNTFAGLRATNLTLSGGKIESLGDHAFSNLSDNLISLNLSTNFISNISISSFQSLKLLSVLDLSNNLIKELNFDTTDLNKLSIFYARNNSITKIFKSVFSHLFLLEELDLSHNALNEIESNAFDSLTKLKILHLNDNDLRNTLDSYAFRGLVGVYQISFTNTKITSYKNETFSNMTLLTTIVSSHGQLTNVAYNTFLNTGSITGIDLSHNLLEDFAVNTSTIVGVKTIYLNNNRLTNITTLTFFGLKSLETLNLSSNNILHVDPNSFQNLSSLLHVYLSSNLDLELDSNIFDNLTWLENVDLSYIRRKFNFINAKNSSISKLLLSRHNLDNINDIFVFHVQNIVTLDLSWNQITYVDKFSFQVMSSLTWLDLSNNLIADIQPGSFSNMHNINGLNLHGNDIQSFKYGVLDGLKNLRILNLSDNALHSFQANVLHSAPYLETLSLDNNNIKMLNFNSFTTTFIQSIYIGGNSLMCSALVDLKNNKYINFTVTSEKLDFGSENVNGITCKTSVRDVLNDVYNNSGGNITWIFKELAKTVVDLQETIKTIAKNTLEKENVMTNALTNVSKSIDILTTSYNKSQIASEKNLKMFIRVLDDLDNKNRTHPMNNTANVDNLGKEGNTVLRSALKDVFLNYHHEDREEKQGFKDVRILLYVIAVTLVLTLGSVLGYFAYIYIIRNVKVRVKSSQCTQPIANAMEMD